MSDAAVVESTPPSDSTTPEDGPWAIKFMPGREREMALKAAKRARRNVGEWLAEAIRAHVESERDESAVYDVFPPGQEVATIGPAADITPLSVEQIGQAVDIALKIASVTETKPPVRLLNAARRALAVRIAR